MPLPAFTADGVLPPGDYPLTLDNLRESRLVAGIGPGVLWDATWRRMLVDNLESLVGDLWRVGVDEVFVDGSFVEDKAHPNDIDGYFICDVRRFVSGELERELNRHARKKVWTWSNRRRELVKGHGWKLPMWRMYRVELYPHFGQPSGIRDRFGNELQLPAAFRISRTGISKGIIKLVR
jgi:hypothetical protein